MTAAVGIVPVLARTAAQFDDRVLDAGFHAAAAAGDVTGRLTARIDDTGVDRGVEGIAVRARRLGEPARALQTGAIHRYLLQAAAVLAAVPAIGPAAARWAWVAVSAVELLLVGVLWAGYEDPGPNELAFEEQVPWIPGVSSSYNVGVDGLSLPLLATAVVFLACAVHALRDADRPRVQAALFLFLQAVSLGVFVAAVGFRSRRH